MSGLQPYVRYESSLSVYSCLDLSCHQSDVRYESSAVAFSCIDISSHQSGTIYIYFYAIGAATSPLATDKEITFSVPLAYSCIDMDSIKWATLLDRPDELLGSTEWNGFARYLPLDNGAHLRGAGPKNEQQPTVFTDSSGRLLTPHTPSSPVLGVKSTSTTGSDPSLPLPSSNFGSPYTADMCNYGPIYHHHHLPSYHTSVGSYKSPSPSGRTGNTPTRCTGANYPMSTPTPLGRGLYQSMYSSNGITQRAIHHSPYPEYAPR
uniref:Uncharacterized protein n=1 Tax=Timema tahoe TaxID=61484 RepID=A0A7R9INQ5_9NEOP|nr:unnamed protein product [Timema tahoe]